MLDIEEFHKIRKRVFVNKDRIHTLSDLQKYYLELEIICFNERSTELVDLLRYTIEIAKEKNNNEILFKLCWLYFLQTYYYRKEMKKTEETVELMKTIASKSKNVEQLALILNAESLLYQINDKNENSIQKITEALNLLLPFKEEYPETFYGTFYSYTLFTSFNSEDYDAAISNMKECLSYYHTKSFNSLGMIYVINLLQRFYLLSNQEKKIDELIQWVFQEQKIQNKINDKHYISLYWYSGTVAAWRYRLPEAIQYLHKAHSRIVENNIKLEAMYEYTDIVRLLSRCYALQGQFQKSYDLLIELLDSVETDSLRENFFEKGIKRIYFSS